ncbi:MAG: amidohydrolase family protein [Acidimicrobiia bacterium]|nr:amidohydrolase family protein [Acidimicrobiia bacterium]
MTAAESGVDVGVAFSGGRILTMDGSGVEPAAVIVQDGRVLATGGRDLIDAYPEAVRVDLADRTLVPGFIDAHNHLTLASLLPAWVDLTSVRDPHAAVARLVSHAAAHPEQPWVRAWGWNQLDTGLHLDADVLDSAGLDKPVIAVDFSFHRAAVCRRGLEILQIGRGTPDPPGGEVGRAGDGAPNGILVERAWSDACAAAVAAELVPERLEAAIVARSEALLADGITCVHDAACPPEAEAVLADMACRATLPIGVVAMPHPRALLARLDPARLDGPVTGEGDVWLRTGAVKLFADGGVAPAVRGDLGGAHLELGTLMPGLADDMRLALGAGFDVAVHAFGNAGFELALDAWVSAGGETAGRRLRVEHACLLSAEQARRAADLGVVAVVQPGFVRHVGRYLGSLDLAGMDWMPFATLRDAGVPIAASSDDPCALHEPVLTAAIGALRHAPGEAPLAPACQSLPYEDWLHAYTHGAAIAGGQAGERGSIRPGLRADLVVLRGALDAETPPQVDETWVAGRCRFRRSSSTPA